jgi:hypothetical protein
LTIQKICQVKLDLAGNSLEQTNILNLNYPSVKDGKYAGVIGVGGLLLARIPEEIAKSREAFFKQQTQARDEAINNDLMKEQHSKYAYQ